MTELDNLIEAIFSLFIVLVLGYIFYIALSALSPALSILFAIAIVIVAVGIVLKLFRG